MVGGDLVQGLIRVELLQEVPDQGAHETVTSNLQAEMGLVD